MFQDDLLQEVRKVSLREELAQRMEMAVESSPAALNAAIDGRATTPDDVLHTLMEWVAAVRDAVLDLADEIDELRSGGG